MKTKVEKYGLLVTSSLQEAIAQPYWMRLSFMEAKEWAAKYLLEHEAPFIDIASGRGANEIGKDPFIAVTRFYRSGKNVIVERSK